MKSFVALALAASVSAIETSTFEYMKYISKHNKSYDTLVEFNMRFSFWLERHNEIKEHNADENRTSSMGHNFLSDWTPEERKALNGLNMATFNSTVPVTVLPETNASNGNVNWCSTENPMSFDACTPVKNQGSCGSCWAFSATESVESAIAIMNKSTPVEYSPQQLVSCSSSYGNAGCGGGWYFWAWDYMQTYAQETEASYPYSNKSFNFGISGTCMYNSSLGVVMTDSPTDYVSIGQSTAQIQAAIDKQPCSVAIDASASVFQSYTSGVITSTTCGQTLDHAVQAVGYGTENGEDYYLVRNSWGSSWGDQGFVKMSTTQNSNGQSVCGMNQVVMYPNAHLV